MKAMRSAFLAAVIVGMTAGASVAQESKSAALAKQLASALDAAKIDSFAVKDPSVPFTYVGVFYLPGAQLLVVSGSYSAPMLMEAKIGRKEFRDAYVDLNSASDPTTRMLIEDAGADGLKAIRGAATIDAASASGKRTQFDNNWSKQQLTEADYMKAYSAADESYAHMLQVLVRAVGDSSVRVAVR